MNGGPTPVDWSEKFVQVEFEPPGKYKIHRLAVRKTKATIFWRPTFNEKTQKFYYDKDAVDWYKIQELQDKMDKWFPGLNFKTKNSKQVHTATCDYLPYDNMISHLQKKEEMNVKEKIKLDKKKKEKDAKAKEAKKEKLKTKRGNKKSKAEKKEVKEDL